MTYDDAPPGGKIAADELELRRALGGVEAHLRRLDAGMTLNRWAWLGPFAGLLLLLFARQVPLAFDRLLAFVIALALPFGLMSYEILRRRSTASSARRADLALDLDDRMATAWYLAQAGVAGSTPLSELQRSDALRALATRDPRRELSFAIWRPGIVLAGLAGLAMLAAAYWPNPQHLELRRRAAVRQAASLVARDIEAGLDGAADLAPEEDAGDRSRSDEVLARLAERLGRSRGLAGDDLSALARAESELSAQRDPAALDSARQAQDLKSRLDALATGGPKARDLPWPERLAAAIASASNAERKALADDLAELAEGAPPDLASTARALEQASDAVAAADAERAEASANEAAAQLAEVLAKAEPARNVESALDQLRSARDKIAEARAAAGPLDDDDSTDRSAGAGPGDEGGLPGPAEGAGSLGGETSGAVAEGARSADGADRSPAGEPAEPSSGGLAEPDPVDLQDDGSGRLGEELLPDGAAESVHAPGPRPSITAVPRYLPAGGPADLGDRTGRSPAAAGTIPDSRLPYRSVLGQYREAAGSAMTRASLRSDQRALVKAYFEALAR